MILLLEIHKHFYKNLDKGKPITPTTKLRPKRLGDKTQGKLLEGNDRMRWWMSAASAASSTSVSLAVWRPYRML